MKEMKIEVRNAEESDIDQFVELILRMASLIPCSLQMKRIMVE